MRSLARHLFSAGLCLGLLAGCVDDLAGPDASDATQQPAPSDKLRHDHLITTTPTGASTPAPGFVILFSGPTVDADGLLSRYGFLSRYGLLSRYDGPSASQTYGLAAEVDLEAFADEYCDDEDGRDDDDDGRDDDDSRDDEDGDLECDEDDLLGSALAVLAADGDVGSIEPDIDLDTTPTPLFEEDEGAQVTPWGVERIGAADADRSGLAAVDLYLFDTAHPGADLGRDGQEDLGGGLAPSAHGFHVAGTAAALDNAEGVVGVAPGVRLVSFALLDAAGQADLSEAVQAIEEVRRRRLASGRPTVVNMSFGADIRTPAYNALDEAVEAAVAAGVVVVVSAGNLGIDAATVTPAHARGAITVGAYDIGDRFAPFSNYGEVVDLLAPGVDVVSLGLGPGGEIGLATSSGTSMAAPHVAGAAALYLARNPTATPAEVERALVEGGRAVVTGVPGGTTNRSVWVGDGFAPTATGSTSGGDEDDDEEEGDDDEDDDEEDDDEEEGDEDD